MSLPTVLASSSSKSACMCNRYDDICDTFCTLEVCAACYASRLLTVFTSEMTSHWFFTPDPLQLTTTDQQMTSPTACHTCFLDYCHIQFVWGCLQLPFGWHWLVMTCLLIKKLKQLFVLGCRLAIIAELHPLQLRHFVHLRLHCIGEDRLESVLIGYCTLFILISFLHTSYNLRSFLQLLAFYQEVW